MKVAQIAQSILSSFVQLYDALDDRDWDKHLIAVLTMCVSYKVLMWSIGFAGSSPRPGIDIAAILGAINAPLMAVQAAVLKFYIESRPSGPYPREEPRDDPHPR